MTMVPLHQHTYIWTCTRIIILFEAVYQVDHELADVWKTLCLLTASHSVTTGGGRAETDSQAHGFLDR
jgi:hypothetical protein